MLATIRVTIRVCRIGANISNRVPLKASLKRSRSIVGF